MKTIHSIYLSILLVLVCILVSVNPSTSQSEVVDKKPPYDASEDAKKIDDWRKKQYEMLRREGKATQVEFKKVDDKALEMARRQGDRREKALEDIFDRAGVKMPARTGTGPNDPDSRGILGDVDFESLPPRERDKVLKAAKGLGYKITHQGDAFTIKELDVTVHREGYSGSMQQSEQVGRAAGKETAVSYGGTDPETGKPKITDKHINTLDNLKKGGHTLTTDPGKMENKDWAEMGKMTSRNMKNGGVINDDLYNKAEMLKRGYSPEAAGIVPDNANSAQREKALKKFHQQLKDANRQAYSNTEKIAKDRTKRLESVVKGREKNLSDAIQKGDPSEIDSAKKKLQDSREKLALHNTKQQAAKEGVIINNGESVIKEIEKSPDTGKQGDSKKIVKEKPASKPGGQIKGKDKVTNLIKENLKIKTAGGIIIFGDAVYEGYKRRMEEDPKRSKLEAAGNATIEATGIPAIYTIAIEAQNEYKGEPGKAAIATVYRSAKAGIVGGVEYIADKAKKIPEANKEFVDMRIAEMEANRTEKVSKAERENQKKYIYDKLIKEGASPVGASKAVEALERGDTKPLHDLRENLKVKKEIKEKAEKEAKTVSGVDKDDKKVDDLKKGEQKPQGAEKPKDHAKPKESTPVKEWEKMTPEERRDALKRNDPKAWEKVKEALVGDSKSAKEVIDAIDKKPTPSKNVDRISDLRSSETKTDQMDKKKERQSTDFAKNTNVADSYSKDRSKRSKEESQKVQTTTGLTQKEREAESEAKDKMEGIKNKGQEQAVESAISKTQEEQATAEQIAQQESKTSLGSTVAGAVAGGLTSGVATGLDSFFGGIGKGTGQQVSSNMGIQPKPTPSTSPSSSGSETQPSSSPQSESQSPSSEGEKQGTSSTSSQASTSSGAQSSGGSSKSSGSSSSGGSKSSNSGTKTSSTTSSGKSKPTSTTTSKPTSSQGSKPDCSEYKRRAESLTSMYKVGAISTTAYKNEMRDLRDLYKNCKGLRTKEEDEPKRSPKTSKTTTTSTQKKPEENKDTASDGHPLNKWHCHGWTGGCCTKGWHCQGNACGPLDPKISADTRACMKNLGIIK